MSFTATFTRATGHPSPHPWQVELASDPLCRNRLLRIPTGFGKTAGVATTWLYHRLIRGDTRWPTRLVWCLPMRVLVEQVTAELQTLCGALGFDSSAVTVSTLMGGVDAGEWALYPERPAILVGTQDMLLSRALNRGYAAPRARWPMEFGLLNQDSLWVLDEVQLMDVGLATSAQLQTFREQNRDVSSRPTVSWWMSATLQPAWFDSVDSRPLFETVPKLTIHPPDRHGPLWDSVNKPRTLVTVPPKDKEGTKVIADLVVAAHLRSGSGAFGPTLAVLNTVDRATSVAHHLRALVRKQSPGTDVCLVHSRFRPNERKVWREQFLTRSQCGPKTDRIVISTQVIEAGVDFSAAELLTDLCPWPSLVQRVGRAARWGGTANTTVFVPQDLERLDDKAVRPYAIDQLTAAESTLALLTELSPSALEDFEQSASVATLENLYPYAPAHLLLRTEIDELFDTSMDLSGADLDISRFIRSGDERDLQVFWRPIDSKSEPAKDIRPHRDELCPVPCYGAQQWLCGKGGKKLAEGKRAWVWSYLDGQWVTATSAVMYPGQVVLVDSECGGYDCKTGFDPAVRTFVDPVQPSSPIADANLFADLSMEADSSEEDESLSATPFQTIAGHGAQVGALAQTLAEGLCHHFAPLLELAGRWHDLGKSHPAFQGSIDIAGRPQRTDLAKAPKAAWPRNKLYLTPTGERRRGFRHELASAMALFAVLKRHAPHHGALLGPWVQLLEQLSNQPLPAPSSKVPPTAIEQEILALAPEDFDLIAYLVCSHHGKVRVSLQASPADQAAIRRDLGPTLRGVREGDPLPEVPMRDRSGQIHHLPETILTLAPATMGLSHQTGAAWTERVLGLLRRYGPFTLAWLEAILRAADQRASRAPQSDPLLTNEVLS